MDTYQIYKGAKSCKPCPSNHITYSTGSKSKSDCEGPAIIIAKGTNLQEAGILRDRRRHLPSSFIGKVRSFKVVRGTWYVYTEKNYGGDRYKLDQGVRRNDVNSVDEQPQILGLSNFIFQSIRPAVSDYMCYLDYGNTYRGYRSKSITGVPCLHWNLAGGIFLGM